MLKYMLDTNICIAIANDRPQQARVKVDDLLGQGRSVLVSVVARYELQYGAAKSSKSESDWKRLSIFFSRLGEIEFDAEDADSAGLIRGKLEKAGTPIGAYDYMIAGQALRRRLTLVTANVKEFGRVRGLHIENWLKQA